MEKEQDESSWFSVIITLIVLVMLFAVGFFIFMPHDSDLPSSTINVQLLADANESTFARGYDAGYAERKEEDNYHLCSSFSEYQKTDSQIRGGKFYCLNADEQISTSTQVFIPISL